MPAASSSHRLASATEQSPPLWLKVKQEQIHAAEKEFRAMEVNGGVVAVDLEPPPGMPGRPPWQSCATDASKARPKTTATRQLTRVTRPKTPSQEHRPRVRTEHASSSQAMMTPASEKYARGQKRPRTTTEYAPTWQESRPRGSTSASAKDAREQKRHKSPTPRGSIRVSQDMNERLVELNKVMHDMKIASTERADNSVDNLMATLIGSVAELAQDACHGILTETDGTVREADFKDARQCSQIFLSSRFC